MSQHIDYNIENGKELPHVRKAPKRIRNQPTLHQVLKSPTCSQDVSCTEDVLKVMSDREEEHTTGTEQEEPREREGTRHYPRFDIHHPSLMQFQRFLTELD